MRENPRVIKQGFQVSRDGAFHRHFTLMETGEMFVEPFPKEKPMVQEASKGRVLWRKFERDQA